MQQTYARTSRSRERGLPRRLAVITLAVAATAVTACHDAATSVLAPAPPTLAVGSDGAWLVNSLADPGDGACTNSECTLREAIAAAQDGDRVSFKNNLTGTINLGAGQLLIEKFLTIDGPGPAKLAVSGQNVSRVFQIGSTTADVIVTVSGLTITGGNALPDNGGGIAVRDNSRLALIASVVTLNTGYTGGGIHNAGRLTLVRSTVAANHATLHGGGIYSSSAVTLNRSTISENQADGWGGGVMTSCPFGPCDGVTLRSSTVTNNDAGELGGGLRISDAGTSWNSIVAGNRVDGSSTDATADCYTGTLESLGYNLSTLDTGCDLSEPTDIVIPLPSLVFTSVLHLVLEDNGGATKTHALVERGFAVDAGYCPGESVDQRGFPRPYDDLRMPNALDGCDIGAFEWHPADTKTKGPKP
jgi:CSLREA domain-containing protein